MSETRPDHDLSCVVHVHSTYSDGTATVPELLAAAGATGVEALLLTDHDSLGARRHGWEGTHDGVFLLVGNEVTPDGGHYLAFGLDHEVAHDGNSSAAIAAAVRSAGGVGFAAHPFSTGGRMLVPAVARRLVLPHGWPVLEEPDAADGIELWSLLTDAAESWRTPLAAWRWLRDPAAAIVGGPRAHQLAAWDALSAERRLPAIAGLDDHQPGFRIGGRMLSLLPPDETFRLLRTHLVCERPLDGDVARDRETIVAALRAGSAWLNCYDVAPAAGARLWAETAAGASVPMGAEAPAGPATLRLRLPRRAGVDVLRDGEPIHAADTAALDLDVDAPGAFRVEARIDGRMWLLSNPVHLR